MNGAVQKKTRWFVGALSGLFLVGLFGFLAWFWILKIVMTPIQWWNGNCTVEYSKQWRANTAANNLLDPTCTLTDDEAVDDEIFEHKQEIERLQREIQKLEKLKGAK